MTDNQYNRLFGIICIIGGLALLILAAGELLLRIGAVIIALYLIHYGFLLQGYPIIRFKRGPR